MYGVPCDTKMNMSFSFGYVLSSITLRTEVYLPSAAVSNIPSARLMSTASYLSTKASLSVSAPLSVARTSIVVRYYGFTAPCISSNRNNHPLDWLIGDTFLRNVYSLWGYNDITDPLTKPYIQMLSVRLRLLPPFRILTFLPNRSSTPSNPGSRPTPSSSRVSSRSRTTTNRPSPCPCPLQTLPRSSGTPVARPQPPSSPLPHAPHTRPRRSRSPPQSPRAPRASPSLPPPPTPPTPPSPPRPPKAQADARSM